MNENWVVNINGLRLPVVCADGFRVSIQASMAHYSIPRENNVRAYKACELGYPSEPDDLIKEYAEQDLGENNYVDCVYPYVPAKVIQALLEKHGGIVSGECPQLDLTESEEE